MQLLIDLTNFLQPYGMLSYLGMFLILLACGFGLPLPEDIILISGGILSSRGVCDIYLVNIVCMAGVLIGDGTIFLIGRSLGPKIKQVWPFRIFLTPENDRKVQKVFDRFGEKVIFLARFMPGLRTPTFATCGAYRVPFWKFFVYDGLAALISVPAWIYVGKLFGENLERLEQIIHQARHVIYAALIGIVLLIILVRYVKKKYLPS